MHLKSATEVPILKRNGVLLEVRNGRVGQSQRYAVRGLVRREARRGDEHVGFHRIRGGLSDRSLIVKADPFESKGGHARWVLAAPELDAVEKWPDFVPLRAVPLRAASRRTVQATKADGVKDGTGVQVRTLLDAFQETVFV